MTPNDKIAWNKAEVSLRRFNDTAIPHHLGLLKNHRSNIEKSLALGDWNKVKKEEINALRVIKQVKNLLLEMDSLRAKVQEDDLDRFDAMMDVGKQKAFEGMKEYLELRLKSPTTPLPSQYTDEEPDPSAQASEISSTLAHQKTIPHIESDFQQSEHQLAQKQACLEEFENLQHEIRDLNSVFHNMHGLVQEQGESVRAIAENAEEALENVQEGESNLRRALTYKKTLYPVVGALLGTCVGGPIGLVAGLKAGGLAAVGCGILGFTGGSVLKSNPSIIGSSMEEIPLEQHQQDMDEEGKKDA